MVRRMRILDSMKMKFPLNVVRIILKGSGFPVGRGWAATLDAVEAMTSQDDFEDREESCVAAYKEALLCLDKTVRVYEVSEDDIDAVRRMESTVEVEENAFSTGFPYCLTSTELENEISDVIQLVAIERAADGVSYIFSSKAYTEVRERYQGNEINPDIVHFFQGADEIIAITKEAKQLFHVVWVPDNGDQIEVRVDTPKDIPTDRIHSMHRSLRLHFNTMVGCHALKNALNVFACVRNIYDTPDEGAVVEMTFATQTASIKNEKMRKSGLDLRTELFHVGGCEAVDDEIDPYKLNVRWEKTRSGYKIYPEVALNGSFRMSQSDNPTLSEFTVFNATCNTDYEFLVNKVRDNI